MSEETKKDSKKSLYTLLLIISVSIIAVGLMYAFISGVFGLPKAEDKFNKYDHFRFEPKYNFLDYTNDMDLGQRPRAYLDIEYYRQSDTWYSKALKETYKDKNGQMIEVVSVTNSTDPIVFLVVKDTEYVKLNPISFAEWNQVLQYDSFDIDFDGTEEHVFRLDVTQARDYYQLVDKEHDVPQLVLMMPIKLKNILGF